MTQQRAAYPLDYSKGPNKSPDDRMRDLADNTTDRVKNLTDRAEEVAREAAEQARMYGEKAQEAAKNFKLFVEKSMKEQPMGTLAAAAVIGFALGAIWKR